MCVVLTWNLTRNIVFEWLDHIRHTCVLPLFAMDLEKKKISTCTQVLYACFKSEVLRSSLFLSLLILASLNSSESQWEMLPSTPHQNMILGAEDVIKGQNNSNVDILANILTEYKHKHAFLCNELVTKHINNIGRTV